jgi:hypothetical protein
MIGIIIILSVMTLLVEDFTAVGMKTFGTTVDSCTRGMGSCRRRMFQWITEGHRFYRWTPVSRSRADFKQQ